MVLFVAANLLAAVAPGYTTVLIARVLAALAAAAFVPTASAVAVRLSQRSIAAGLWLPSSAG